MITNQSKLLSVFRWHFIPCSLVGILLNISFYYTDYSIAVITSYRSLLFNHRSWCTASIDNAVNKSRITIIKPPLVTLSHYSWLNHRRDTASCLQSAAVWRQPRQYVKCALESLKHGPDLSSTLRTGLLWQSTAHTGRRAPAQLWQTSGGPGQIQGYMIYRTLLLLLVVSRSALNLKHVRAGYQRAGERYSTPMWVQAVFILC